MKFHYKQIAHSIALALPIILNYVKTMTLPASLVFEYFLIEPVCST